MEQDLNTRLRQLALTAQSHPPLSPERQLALSQLVDGIWTSGKIAHPQRGQWPTAVYRELHSEALQQTFLHICQKIELYRPEHPVMAWVNSLMGFKLLEAVKNTCRTQETVVPSLDDLNQRFLKQKSYLDDDGPSEIQILRKLLREDPEGMMGQKSIRGRPEISFQYLAIARHIENKTWVQISAETDISLQTLCCFFNRTLRKLRPYFYKYLQD